MCPNAFVDLGKIPESQTNTKKKKKSVMGMTQDGAQKKLVRTPRPLWGWGWG